MGNPSNEQREIDTETIRKTVDVIQARQRPSSAECPALPCRDHESRIIQLEACRSEHKQVLSEHKQVLSEHGKRLHSGDIGFVQMRADLHALTKAVNDAVDQMKVAAGVNWWHEVLRAVINWGVPVAILVLVWALVGSGAVPLKGHP